MVYGVCGVGVRALRTQEAGAGEGRLGECRRKRWRDDRVAVFTAFRVNVNCALWGRPRATARSGRM